MNMDRDDQFLRTEYLKNLFPVMFSVLGGTINALIDSVFVSRRLGADALAAVNMSMPVYLVICTFGALIAGGASVMSARAAGQERMEEAAAHYHAAMTACFVFGVLFTAAGGIFCRPVAGLLSQGGELEAYVYEYCFVTMLGVLPTVLAYLPLYYLQLDGKTHEITVTIRIMILADILLDYVFLYVFPFGIYGAAAASLMASLLSCIYGFISLERGYSNYHFQFVKVGVGQIKEIIRYGSPSASGNFADAIKLLLLNMVILHAGGASAAAVWAVLNSMSEFSISITSGVPQAAAPMAGAYVSARENSGLRILMRLQMQWGLLLSAAYAAVLVVGSKALGRVFSVEQSLVVPFLCLGSFVILDLAASVWITFFQAAGRLVLSNLLVICRKLVFPVGIAALLMLADGYLWTFLPLGGACTVIAGVAATGMIYIQNRKGNHALSRFLLLDDYLEREKKVLDFSIVPTAENICSASEQIIDFCRHNHMDSKQTMKLQLSIEELLTVIVQKNPDMKTVDLRAFSLEENTGIRIRCAGIRYNPFEKTGHEDDDFLMGVVMLEKMSNVVQYTYSFGMNIINVLI